MRSALAGFALLITACDATLTEEGTPTGTLWTLTTQDNAPFEAPATLRFLDDGTVTGQAPCNRFWAKLLSETPEFALGPIASTKVACTDLQKEQQFFTTLAAMTTSRLSDETLILSNPDGQVLVFKAADEKP